MKKEYVLQKNGMFYAHNDCGYTNSLLTAELYTKEYALDYAEKSQGTVTARHVTEIMTPNRLNECLARIEELKKVILGPMLEMPCPICNQHECNPGETWCAVCEDEHRESVANEY